MGLQNKGQWLLVSATLWGMIGHAGIPVPKMLPPGLKVSATKTPPLPPARTGVVAKFLAQFNIIDATASGKIIVTNLFTAQAAEEQKKHLLQFWQQLKSAPETTVIKIDGTDIPIIRLDEPKQFSPLANSYASGNLLIFNVHAPKTMAGIEKLHSRPPIVASRSMGWYYGSQAPLAKTIFALVSAHEEDLTRKISPQTESAPAEEGLLAQIKWAQQRGLKKTAQSQAMPKKTAEEREAAKKEIEQKERDIQTLQATLTTCLQETQKDRDSITNSIEDLDIAIAGKSAEITEREQEFERKIEETIGANPEVKKIRNTIEHKKLTIERARQHLESIKKIIGEKEQTLNEAKEKVSAGEAALNARRAELAKAQQEKIRAAISDIAHLKTEFGNPKTESSRKTAIRTIVQSYATDLGKDTLIAEATSELLKTFIRDTTKAPEMAETLEEKKASAKARLQRRATFKKAEADEAQLIKQVKRLETDPEKLARLENDMNQLREKQKKREQTLKDHEAGFEAELPQLEGALQIQVDSVRNNLETGHKQNIEKLNHDLEELKDKRGSLRVNLYALDQKCVEARDKINTLREEIAILSGKREEEEEEKSLQKSPTSSLMETLKAAIVVKTSSAQKSPEETDEEWD